MRFEGRRTDAIAGLVCKMIFIRHLVHPSNEVYRERHCRRTLTRSSNFSNTASLLWHAYHSLPGPSSSVNWSGFYFLNPSKPQQLLLGPFHGQVACQTINFGRGVCGAAAKTQQTQLVPDVEKFPGHIACDGASKSEIVVPIVKDGKVCVLFFLILGRADLTCRSALLSLISTVLRRMGSMERTRSHLRSWPLCSLEPATSERPLSAWRVSRDPLPPAGRRPLMGCNMDEVA